MESGSAANIEVVVHSLGTYFAGDGGVISSSALLHEVSTSAAHRASANFFM
jgi:hypothetical protein